MTGTTKTQRWLDLIAFLVGRRLPVAVEQIRDAVPGYARGPGEDIDKDSVRKRFERDKDELRRLGIPIETVDFRVEGDTTSGYRLRSKDFYLPYLRLLQKAGAEPPGHNVREPHAAFQIAPEDLRIAVEGLNTVADLPAFPLRREARSAVRKLTFDLEEPLRETPRPVLVGADPDESRGAVEQLTRAVTRKKRVAFTYRGIARDQATERHVRPYGVLFKFGHWYLVGFDEDREALRTFRISRVADSRVRVGGGTTPDFEVPDDLDLRAWSQGEAWDLPGDDTPATDVVVRFDFPRSLWADRNSRGEALGPAADDGSQLRRFSIRQEGPFLRWLLSLAGDAEIVEPAELRDRFRALAAQVAALYGAPDG